MIRLVLFLLRGLVFKQITGDFRLKFQMLKNSHCYLIFQSLTVFPRTSILAPPLILFYPCGSEMAPHFLRLLLTLYLSNFLCLSQAALPGSLC